VSTKDGINRAEEVGLDLVEIVPKADPPVCKIMDFGKYLYKQQMKKKDSKKKQHKVKVKEIRFRPRIDTHDLEMKINHARKFLEKGNRVKITVMFIGRELAHREIGDDLINKVIEDLSEVGEIDKRPKNEGRTIVAFLTSK